MFNWPDDLVDMLWLEAGKLAGRQGAAGGTGEGVKRLMKDKCCSLCICTYNKPIFRAVRENWRSVFPPKLD